MKHHSMRTIVFFVLVLSVIKSFAQTSAYVTNVPDTSFTITSDYRKNIKKYPFIIVARDSSTVLVSEQRNLVYCETGNRKLHIDAFTPAVTEKPAPAVILVHGGGWRSGDRTHHIPLAQRLAALGYASFTVEYRLSTEAPYPAAVADVRSSIRWLRANAKKLRVDPNKIVVLGFSAGGQLAALTGLAHNVKKFDEGECNKKQRSDVQAVIDIDGTLSFVHPDAWETQNPETINASARWLGYPRTERIDLWVEASPFTYAEDNKIPFLFLQSAVTRMHTGHTEFSKMMESKGVYTEVVNFGDTPHTFCFYHPWFNPMVKNIDSFLRKVFK